jgi:hypothetical protein
MSNADSVNGADVIRDFVTRLPGRPGIIPAGPRSISTRRKAARR